MKGEITIHATWWGLGMVALGSFLGSVAWGFTSELYFDILWRIAEARRKREELRCESESTKAAK